MNEIKEFYFILATRPTIN